MVVFTDLGRLISIVFLCFFLIGYVHGSALMYMIAFFCLALIVVSAFLSWHGMRGVHCRRDLSSSTAYSGDPLDADILLSEPAGRWRLLELLDQQTNLITQQVTHRRMTIMTDGGRSRFAAVSGNQQSLRRTGEHGREGTLPDVMRFAQRGHYRLGPLMLYSYDPFGLTYRKRTLKETQEIIVYPHPFPLPQLVLGGVGGRQNTEVRPVGHVGETADFHSIRPYVQGDDLRRIHWKSTAHTGKLAVKEYEYHSSGAVQVVLDLQRGIHLGANEFSTLETSVTVAASVLNYVMEGGNHIGLFTTGEKVVSLAPESGDRQLHRALEALALAKDDGVTPLASALASGEAKSGRCTTIVVTPTLDKSIIGPLLSLRGRSTQVLLVLLDPSSYYQAEQDALKAGQSFWSLATSPISLKKGLRAITTPKLPPPAPQAHQALRQAAIAAGIEVYPLSAELPLHQALQGLRSRI